MNEFGDQCGRLDLMEHYERNVSVYEVFVNDIVFLIVPM